MIITNLTDVDYWFGPMHLGAGSGTATLDLDDTSDTSLYLLNDEVADAVNTLYLASNITVSSAAQPFPRATGTPSLLHGDGSPEGMVYAPQGSLYMRRDTVQTSTSLYSKQTGVTQNTGWASVIGPAAGDLVPSAAMSRVGCLLCDGTSYLRATYPVLFGAIGMSYGSVDGTQFNVPDLRGRLPLGAGTGTAAAGSAWRLGEQPTIGAPHSGGAPGAGGEEAHTLVSSEMPVHNHDTTEPGHSHSTAMDVSPGSNYLSIYIPGGYAPNYGESAYAGFVNTQAAYTGIEIQDAGGDGDHNTMPPVSVVNWFIVHG